MASGTASKLDSSQLRDFVRTVENRATRPCGTRNREAELVDGGSDRLIDAMVLWGDADTIRRGLRAHFAAGATHVCLQPVHADGDFAARDRMLAALADT